MMEKREQLEYWMRKGVGKRCFVNCFEAALKNNGYLTESDIVKSDPAVGRKQLKRRMETIGHIFREGWQWDALRECLTVFMDKETEKKAAALCEKYNVR